MTIREWIASAADRLDAAGVDAARLEAQVLAAQALGCSRAELIARDSADFDSSDADVLLVRRLVREPLAYIVGCREFYGRRFQVRPGVLIPRQETEMLVEWAVAESPGTVLDLGCGSGCIGISIALEVNGCAVTCSDVSPDALEIARENAASLGAKVQFLLADGLPNGVYEVIVSNPPYIAAGESLMPEVADFEPALALFAGADGLDFYRRLAHEAASSLLPGGKIALELGAGQALDVRDLFEGADWRWVDTRLDLAGIERVIVFQRP